MNLALIKDRVVVNIIVVEGDGSSFLETADPVWRKQFDEIVVVDPAKVRCAIGFIRTADGFVPAETATTEIEATVQPVQPAPASTIPAVPAVPSTPKKKR